MTRFDERFEKKFEESIAETGEVARHAGLKAAGVAVVTGTGAAAATGATVAAVGTASTGTAIATLGGAAATKATLAAIGGGSLATGGLGMAAGAAILASGGLAVAVAGGVGAYMYMTRSQPQPKQETETEDEKVAYLQTLHLMGAIDGDTQEADAVLAAVAARLEVSSKLMKSGDEEPWRRVQNGVLRRRLVRDLLLLKNARDVCQKEKKALVEKVAATFDFTTVRLCEIEEWVRRSTELIEVELDLFR